MTRVTEGRGRPLAAEGARARRGVTERLALGALDYPIPARANRLDFMLGALTLVALTVLALTGVVLTQYYNPTPLAAHGSVRYMITDVPLVSYMRDLHVWSASAALVLVFTHLAAVFWRRGFRRPRATRGPLAGRPPPHLGPAQNVRPVTTPGRRRTRRSRPERPYGSACGAP